jgi:hypothetical protein
MSGEGNASVAVEIRISAAANLEPGRASAGNVVRFEMRGRAVPLGPAGMAWAVRVEAVS